jgi:hypothetical protein
VTKVFRGALESGVLHCLQRQALNLWRSIFVAASYIVLLEKIDKMRTFVYDPDHESSNL